MKTKCWLSPGSWKQVASITGLRRNNCYDSWECLVSLLFIDISIWAFGVVFLHHCLNYMGCANPFGTPEEELLLRPFTCWGGFESGLSGAQSLCPCALEYGSVCFWELCWCKYKLACAGKLCFLACILFLPIALWRWKQRYPLLFGSGIFELGRVSSLEDMPCAALHLHHLCSEK